MKTRKFRAWDIKEKRWLKYKDLDIDKIIDGDGFRLLVKNIIGFPEETITCQYTELKDKNGKEIYEGDIVKSEQYPFYKIKKYVVKWDEMGFYPFNNFCENPEIMGFMNSIFCEVIGNIYENPKLIN